MLGHSMGTLRLYELPREVQKLLWGSGGILPPKISASQVGSEVIRTVAKRKLLTADSRMRLVILCIYIWLKSNLDQVNSEGPTRRDWRMRSGPALVHMFFVTPTTAASYLVLFLLFLFCFALLLRCVGCKKSR